MSRWPLAYLPGMLDLPKWHAQGWESALSGICFILCDPCSACPQLRWSLLLYEGLFSSIPEFKPYLDHGEGPTMYPQPGHQDWNSISCLDTAGISL